jgi:hypothetical protein
MKKKKAAQFGVIDSVQYAGFDYDYYKEMKRELRKKSLLFISHAQGNNPLGRTADSIRYDARIKVHVIGYMAKVISRYGGNMPFIIWEEGAKKYWGKKFNSVKEGKYWPGQKNSYGKNKSLWMRPTQNYYRDRLNCVCKIRR